VRRFLSYSRAYPDLDVPDPYYGGRDGFDRVIDMVEDGVEGLLAAINKNSA
jgi:protein-tyrosine phosphatase